MRKINFTIRHKKKIGLVVYLVIFMFFMTAFQSVQVRAVDDNYSTYLYNQNINVDNDKAHLLADNSDGSNSYRNIFQSNFLFPAKLSNDMLSTTSTTEYSRYNFNQFYFDDLDNPYNYQNYDSENNIIGKDILENYEIEKGSISNDGSTEFSNDVNATYNFENYNESELGYYFMSDSIDFNNETIGTSSDTIKWIDIDNSNDGCTVLIIDNFENHNNVLKIYDNNNDNERAVIEHLLDDSVDDMIFEGYYAVSDNTKGYQLEILIYQNATKLIHSAISYNDFHYWYVGGSADIKSNFVVNNEFFHIKMVLDDSENTFDCYINGVLEGNDLLFFTNSTEHGANKIKMNTRSYTVKDYNVYIDALGINGIESYTENDNTNPYGMDLQNYGFDILNEYGNSVSINQENSLHNNVLNVSDNNILKSGINIPFNSSQSVGTIEYMVKSTDCSRWNFLYLKREGAYPNAIATAINSDNFMYVDDITGWTNIPNVEIPIDNEWYHIKIVFNIESSTNVITYYVNGVSSGLIYTSSGYDYISKIFIGTSTTDIDYSVAFDNLDCSWSNGYYDNRILYPNSDLYKINRTEVITDSGSFNLLPNSDITTPMSNYWGRSPSYTTPIYPALRDDGSTYAYTDAHSNNPSIAELGIDDSDFDCLIENITIKIKSLIWYYTMTTSDYIKISTNLDNYTTWYKCSNYGYNNQWIYDYFELDINNDYITSNQLNNLQFKISAYDSQALFFQVDYVQFQVDYYNYTLDNIDVSYEQNINYIENYKPYSYDIYFNTFGFNSSYLNISILNYDLQEYYLMKEYTEIDYNTYSFNLNESAYFRFNKIKIKIISLTETINSLLIVDYLSLNISYVLQNSEGYQELVLYNQRYDNDNNYLGYSSFEFLIYNDSIKYRYSEINLYKDDYIYAWIVISTSNLNVENIELQCHSRYGLNTLDIEILNFYYIIYINYDTRIELFEQSRKELNATKLKSSFNYTSHNRNFMNLTGVVGNYSYTSFDGCRSLYGLESETFHRYFTLPYFSDDIDVSIPLDLPSDIYSNPSEPTPLTSYYWTYESFETEYYMTIPISVGNWTVDFNMMRSKSITAKYYYQPKSVDRDDLGSWKWKIKFSADFSYKIDFNFMRNAVCSIINLVLLFAQWIMYLVVGGLSYIFMYLGTTILVFLWNFLVFYLFTALIFILWYIYEGLYTLLLYIWEGLVWVYENLLIPFLYWFWEYGIPILIDWLIIILAHIITIVIWIITMGEGDYDAIYENVYTMLRYIADEIIAMITTFLNNFEYIILFILYYLLLTGLVYVRYLYCKARGFNKRAEQLKEAFDVFIIPIQLTLYLFKTTKDLVDPYTS